ncbi:DUF4123 domain-containing protein [Massilia consociata]|uniref:DUF4123 domain-containing protein n=1 Tax=Massilia consociata TaxID=760117 RepID=A0ABV6FL50_9BURK
MYFASNPCNTLALSRELVENIRKQPGLTWFALIDGAFDYGRQGVVLPNARDVLYDHDGMSDLLAASPFLIELTVQDEGRLGQEIATLLRHRKERPMLSFIGTCASARAVNDNFRLFANAVTEDDQVLLLRFADTRVLPGLSTALRPAYWDGMTCMLSDWITIGRDGQQRSLPLNANRAPMQGRFRLSPAEFAALLANGEPDAVLDAIAEGNPEALPALDRATIHHKVAQACSFAQQHQVRAFPDVVALAYLALLNDGKGLRDPKLSEMLLRAEWESGRLIDRLADFVE